MDEYIFTLRDKSLWTKQIVTKSKVTGSKTFSGRYKVRQLRRKSTIFFALPQCFSKKFIKTPHKIKIADAYPTLQVNCTTAGRRPANL